MPAGSAHCLCASLPPVPSLTYLFQQALPQLSHAPLQSLDGKAQGCHQTAALQGRQVCDRPT